MKENVEFNEEFCKFHLDLESAGVAYPEIRKQAIKKYSTYLSRGKEKTLSAIKHAYRATVDRLANPQKYGGRYVYMSRFQNGKKLPAVAESVIPAQS